MDIVYEDNHLIIVNKSAGELSQSDHTGDLSLVDKVKNYIKTKYKKPGNVYLGLVNRLDRPTSGLVIFSRTSKSLVRMNKLIKERNKKNLSCFNLKITRTKTRIYHKFFEKKSSKK